VNVIPVLDSRIEVAVELTCSVTWTVRDNGVPLPLTVRVP
jgi:hypothetical protein